jgi:hypothetical protein
MCKTCIKLRKAAFAVIRTIARTDVEKDKQSQVDDGAKEKSRDEVS